jgi:hypothetical protein
MAPVVLALIAGGLLGQTVEELRLTVGKSIVLDYPGDIRQISTSDPAIVDAVAVSTREVLLNAKAAGSATVVIWARTGQRTIYSVNIEQNLEPLRRLLKDTFPTENIQVQSTRDAIALTGQVSTKEIAERAIAMVTPFGRSIVNNPERYRPLALDLRGHGAARAARPITFAACVADVAAAAPERFVLCGYSLGGRVALHVALAHPERVSRLVLVASTAGIEDPALRAERRAEDEALAAETERGPIEAFAERWMRRPLFAGTPPAAAASWRADLLRNDPVALAGV